MFRKFSRLFLPNRLDWLCRKKPKKVLLGWNRGLGDIPLGLFAIVHRIKTLSPDAEVTFLIRKNLEEGFSLFNGVRVLIAPDWRRGVPYDVEATLRTLKRSPEEFDLIIPYPKPADWAYWQYGKLTPKLSWKEEYDSLWKKFNLPQRAIGIHVHAETDYALWRNWPEQRLREFLELAKEEPIILFGLKNSPSFEGDRIIDLRGKTSLLEIISIVKNCCKALIAPDSGILSTIYYLDAAFPLTLCSLWADPKHGILKQGVSSPNQKLIHVPLIANHRDLSAVSAEEVMNRCAE